jgi:hypothetical protein
MTNISDLYLPQGTKLYSPICGECEVVCSEETFVEVRASSGQDYYFDAYGKYTENGECLLFPSKDNQDWTKILKGECPFKPFDKVVVRFKRGSEWHAAFFSNFCPSPSGSLAQYHTTADRWCFDCLPYNEETAKLIGTTDECDGIS